jgi:glycosyltransferase involved in cell wall biosynthesis
MRIAFNALSVDNLSGRHVLLGHIRQVLAAGGERHLLLHHAGNRDLTDALQGRIDTVECPPATRSWRGRWWWEATELPSLLRRNGVQALFSPAGITASRVELPQLVLAQNPWCFVRQVQHGGADHFKAVLQRAAYRKAQRHAALMLFNSDYMRRAYRDNAGSEPREGLLLLQGLEDETFASGLNAPAFAERKAEILVVSVMARHKAIEDVVDALAVLRRHGVDATLSIVGPWADAGYEQQIRRQIQALGLARHASICGKVSRDQLHAHYARARVFCLLSRCESFGIPAVEAQAFGTPCVVADCGAPPEIAGPGGVVVPPGAVEASARALARMLNDESWWLNRSAAARKNVQRFRWAACSRPLADWIDGRRLSPSSTPTEAGVGA